MKLPTVYDCSIIELPRIENRAGNITPEALEKTVRWYLDNQEWMDDTASGKYKKYYNETITQAVKNLRR